MTQEHPITPPPELVKQWATANGTVYKDLSVFCQNIANEAARWGADQELEACCEWLNDNFDHCNSADRSDWLRAARRPKPVSLQDQALDDLERIAALLMKNNLPCDTGNIRRALESLPD